MDFLPHLCMLYVAIINSSSHQINIFYIQKLRKRFFTVIVSPLIYPLPHKLVMEDMPHVEMKKFMHDIDTRNLQIFFTESFVISHV